MILKDKKGVLISIVIPCYNAKKCICACVGSLLQQSYGNWEAIFINDGSKDNTLDLLKESAQCDSRIKVYSHKNQGAAKSREVGISKAIGEYVTFLDVDDTLEANALEVLLDSFTPDVDIVKAGFNIVNKDRIIKREILQESKWDSFEYLKRVLIGKYGWELWGAGYRTSLFSSPIQCPVGLKIGEDAAILFQLLSKARCVRTISDNIYNYIQQAQSASHIRNTHYAEEPLKAALFIEDYLRKQPSYQKLFNEINSMHLLFYSNSNRKAHLSNSNPFVKNIITKHLRFEALAVIPFHKVIYILACLLLGALIKRSE